METIIGPDADSNYQWFTFEEKMPKDREWITIKYEKFYKSLRFNSENDLNLLEDKTAKWTPLKFVNPDGTPYIDGTPYNEIIK